MKKLLLSVAFSCALLGIAFYVYRAPSDQVPIDTAIKVNIDALDSFPASTSFTVGRFPGVVDAKQSEPVLATITGYYTFLPEAFEGVLNQGSVIGAFERELKHLSDEREFLREGLVSMQRRVDLMGEMERERKLQKMTDSIESAVESVKILGAIEDNPELEGVLMDTASFDAIKRGDDLHMARLSLKMLEAEKQLLTSEDPSKSAKVKAFEMESRIEELDGRIKALSSTMPFKGKFTAAFPSDVLGREILIEAGKPIGVASDSSSIFIGIVSTDPELAALDTDDLITRVKVGRKKIDGAFIEKSFVEVRGRAVPLYRFQLANNAIGLEEMIGSQVSCEIIRECDVEIITLTKLKIVRMALDKGIVPAEDWKLIIEELYPEVEFFAETKSSVIVRI